MYFFLPVLLFHDRRRKTLPEAFAVIELSVVATGSAIVSTGNTTIKKIFLYIFLCKW